MTPDLIDKAQRMYDSRRFTMAEIAACCRSPRSSLLIEMDARTVFLDAFTHAGGKQARSVELKRNLIAVLIAGATNLGLTPDG